MFKRKKNSDVVVRGPPQPDIQVQLPDTAVMQRMLGEFMASTALSRVQSDIGQIAADFREFKDNVGRLNSAIGEFREKAILPTLRELEYLRYNLGARSEDNIGAMSKLVHHLQSQLEVLLKSNGVNPHQRDAVGETPLDKMGLPPDRPDYQTLEREGVQLVESGNAQADQITMLEASNDRMKARLEQILTIARGGWGTTDEGHALQEIIRVAGG